MEEKRTTFTRTLIRCDLLELFEKSCIIVFELKAIDEGVIWNSMMFSNIIKNKRSVGNKFQVFIVFIFWWSDLKFMIIFKILFIKDIQFFIPYTRNWQFNTFSKWFYLCIYSWIKLQIRSFFFCILRILVDFAILLQ